MSIRRGKRAICIRTGSGGCDVLIRPRSRDYFFTGDGCAICKVATDTLRIGHDLLRTLHCDFIVGQFSRQRCCNSSLYIFLTILYVHAKLSQNSSGYQFLVTMDFVRNVQSVGSYL